MAEFTSFLSLQDKAHFVLVIDDMLQYGKYGFDGNILELIDDQKGKLDLDIIQVKKDFVQVKGDFSLFNFCPFTQYRKTVYQFRIGQDTHS